MAKIYPNFASETEEANWLYENREELDEYFAPVAIHLQEAFAEHDLMLPEALLAVPLSLEDRAEADVQAKAQGVAPEEYIGRVVHEALRMSRAA